MIVGNLDPLHLRVNIDDMDIWRLKAGTAAFAILRGNSSITTPLEFNHIEPFVIPKKSFTGEDTERVDTRVMQVIYSFPRGDLPIYPGQMMDVFIESEANYIPQADRQAQ